MRLITILWPRVKWEKILFWYIFGMAFMVFKYFSGVDISTIILGMAVLTFFILMIVLMVWNNVIYGYSEGFPIIWIWSYVVSDIKIKKANPNFIKMEKWCESNIEGKWEYCETGHFSFKKKTDAMAFKLRWVE